MFLRNISNFKAYFIQSGGDTVILFHYSSDLTIKLLNSSYLCLYSMLEDDF